MALDHLVDEWNQMRFKNSALHFMSLSSLEGEMATLVGKMPLLVGYLS
jgi:hypothetical protein